jgi:hypothetical protein
MSLVTCDKLYSVRTNINRYTNLASLLYSVCASGNSFKIFQHTFFVYNLHVEFCKEYVMLGLAVGI